MRNHINVLLPFLVFTGAPSVAFAESTHLLATAGNGPWIALAVVGMVRAMLCLGARPGCDDLRHDHTP